MLIADCSETPHVKVLHVTLEGSLLLNGLIQEIRKAAQSDNGPWRDLFISRQGAHRFIATIHQAVSDAFMALVAADAFSETVQKHCAYAGLRVLALMGAMDCTFQTNEVGHKRSLMLNSPDKSDPPEMGGLVWFNLLHKFTSDIGVALLRSPDAYTTIREVMYHLLLGFEAFSGKSLVPAMCAEMYEPRTQSTHT